MRVERKKSPEEAEEFKDLKEVTAEKLFIHRLGQVEYEYTKAHKPFCRKCAIEEFRMQKENLYNEMKLKYKRDFSQKEQPFMDFAKNFSLDKYGKNDYFTLVGTERINMRRREGGDVWFELNVNKNYACKPYGHGCTISICQSEMNDEELAMEKKRKEEIKSKVAATDTNLPSVDDNRLPPGQLGDKAKLNPQPVHKPNM